MDKLPARLIALKDKKKEPAYGADVLRLWAATVEYWRDMSIGPTVLAQTAESTRKIRNSTRFLLGNIGSTASQDSETHSGVDKKDLGLVRISMPDDAQATYIEAGGAVRHE